MLATGGEGVLGGGQRYFFENKSSRNLSQNNFFPECQGPLPASWGPLFTFLGGVTPPTPPRWHDPAPTPHCRRQCCPCINVHPWFTLLHCYRNQRYIILCVFTISFQGNFLHGATYRMFENFFDMPAMLLCARLIDIVDKEVSAMSIWYRHPQGVRSIASSARSGAGFPWGGAWGSLTAHSPLQSATLPSQHYHYLRWPNLHVCHFVSLLRRGFCVIEESGCASSTQRFDTVSTM